jgi:addiction module HigA family antidote
MKRHPSINVHPGSILKKDILSPAKLSIGEAADLLHVSRLTLSEIVNERGAITPNIAIRISKAFGGKADFWLRMQRGYDLRKAEQEFDENPIEINKFKFA